MANAIQNNDLHYLATPYSKYPGGINKAFQDACVLASRLVVAGYNVYSPIAHTHPIALYGHLDPLDHTIWLPFDEAMMKVCGTLLVADMTGWEESKGINYEIDYFRKERKQVFLLCCDMLLFYKLEK